MTNRNTKWMLALLLGLAALLILIGCTALAEETYTVTVNDFPGSFGYVNADKTENVQAGETVTLTPTAVQDYYMLRTLTVMQGQTPVVVTAGSNSYTFEMPEGDVTVSSVFEPYFDVHFRSNYYYGTVSRPNGDVAFCRDDYVVMQITPKRGYKLDEGYPQTTDENVTIEKSSDSIYYVRCSEPGLTEYIEVDFTSMKLKTLSLQITNQGFGSVNLLLNGQVKAPDQTSSSGSTYYVYPGDVITLDVMPGTGASLSVFTVDEVDHLGDLTDGSYTFMIPDSSRNTYVYIAFQPVEYAVLHDPVAEADGISFSHLQNTYHVGDTVYVQVSKAGAEITGVYYSYEADGVSHMVLAAYADYSGQWEFTMPASDVTLYADPEALSYALTPIAGTDGLTYTVMVNDAARTMAIPSP